MTRSTSVLYLGAIAIVGNSSACGGNFIFSVGARNEPATYAGTRRETVYKGKSGT